MSCVVGVGSSMVVGVDSLLGSVARVDQVDVTESLEPVVVSMGEVVEV